MLTLNKCICEILGSRKENSGKSEECSQDIDRKKEKLESPESSHICTRKSVQVSRTGGATFPTPTRTPGTHHGCKFLQTLSQCWPGASDWPISRPGQWQEARMRELCPLLRLLLGFLALPPTKICTTKAFPPRKSLNV